MGFGTGTFVGSMPLVTAMGYGFDQAPVPATTTAQSVQEELELKTAERIWAVNSQYLRCVVQQMVPRDTYEAGKLLHGAYGTPFVSVSSILPESIVDGSGWHNRDLIVRPVTVVIYGDRLSVDRNPGLYKKIRERAVRSIQKYRWELVQENSCVWYGNVRHQSQLSAAAWIQQGRFISAFDVLFRTQEPRLHT
jgi:hypothetical protein